MRELTKLAFAMLVLCAGLSPSHDGLATTVAVTREHARHQHGAHPHAQFPHARPPVHVRTRQP
jgi:hypothetical protein